MSDVSQTIDWLTLPMELWACIVSHLSSTRDIDAFQRVSKTCSQLGFDYVKKLMFNSKQQRINVNTILKYQRLQYTNVFIQISSPDDLQQLSAHRYLNNPFLAGTYDFIQSKACFTMLTNYNFRCFRLYLWPLAQSKPCLLLYLNLKMYIHMRNCEPYLNRSSWHRFVSSLISRTQNIEMTSPHNIRYDWIARFVYTLSECVEKNPKKITCTENWLIYLRSLLYNKNLQEIAIKPFDRIDFAGCFDIMQKPRLDPISLKGPVPLKDIHIILAKFPQLRTIGLYGSEINDNSNLLDKLSIEKIIIYTEHPYQYNQYKHLIKKYGQRISIECNSNYSGHHD